MFVTSPAIVAAVIFFIIAVIFLPKGKTVVTTVSVPVYPTPTVLAAVSPVSASSLHPVDTAMPTRVWTVTPTLSFRQVPSDSIPTPTAVSISQVRIQINEPDGNSVFSLALHSGGNPCSILTDAKNADKIRSVTLVEYGAPLNSAYVKELNGYSENWTFTLNGVSEPKGCSNYQLGNGDTVVWTYK